MACTGYKPRFQDQINPYDPLGGLNCTTYSGAMAGDYHTCGAKVPTGKRVRELTGDRSGGTTLTQVDYALRRGWNIDLDTRIGSARLTWSQFEDKIDAGRAAILQGSYRVIRPTRFTGSTTFTGNHAILVLPGWVVMDPLCDGRRPGIYKYHGEVYPKELLKRFAGDLVLTPSTGRRLGFGLTWASFTRDNTVSYKVIIRPKPPATKKAFTHYIVKDGIIQGRVGAVTGGFEQPCTAPRIYKAKAGLGYTSKSLVKVTNRESRYYGWYFTTGYAYEA